VQALEHATRLSTPAYQPRGLSSVPTMLDEPSLLHLGQLEQLQQASQVHLEVTRQVLAWRTEIVRQVDELRSNNRSAEGCYTQIDRVRDDHRRFRELAQWGAAALGLVSVAAVVLGFASCVGTLAILWRLS
jgi:hypothetical protein